MDAKMLVNKFEELKAKRDAGEHLDIKEYRAALKEFNKTIDEAEDTALKKDLFEKRQELLLCLYDELEELSDSVMTAFCECDMGKNLYVKTETKTTYAYHFAINPVETENGRKNQWDTILSVKKEYDCSKYLSLSSKVYVINFTDPYQSGVDFSEETLIALTFFAKNSNGKVISAAEKTIEFFSGLEDRYKGLAKILFKDKARFMELLLTKGVRFP